MAKRERAFAREHEGNSGVSEQVASNTNEQPVQQNKHQEKGTAVASTQTIGGQWKYALTTVLVSALLLLLLYVIGWFVNVWIGEPGLSLTKAVKDVVDFLLFTAGEKIVIQLGFEPNFWLSLLAVVLFYIAVSIVIYIVELATPKSDHDAIKWVVIVLLLAVAMCWIQHLTGIAFSMPEMEMGVSVYGLL